MLAMSIDYGATYIYEVRNGLISQDTPILIGIGHEDTIYQNG